MILSIVLIAVGGTLVMRLVQHLVWPSDEKDPQQRTILKLEGTLVAIAIAIGLVFAFFPSQSFIDDTTDTPYYIVPLAHAEATP